MPLRLGSQAQFKGWGLLGLSHFRHRRGYWYLLKGEKGGPERWVASSKRPPVPLRSSARTAVVLEEHSSVELMALDRGAGFGLRVRGTGSAPEVESD